MCLRWKESWAPLASPPPPPSDAPAPTTRPSSGPTPSVGFDDHQQVSPPSGGGEAPRGGRQSRGRALDESMSSSASKPECRCAGA